MTSKETILNIYWTKLSKGKRGKKETVFRCPRIAYQAAVLTEDPKLEELFIDTHSSIKRYDDEFRQAFDSARREIHNSAHEAHRAKYPREEGTLLYGRGKSGWTIKIWKNLLSWILLRKKENLKKY